MPVISFQISGEFITRHARNLATEGTGDGALKFLMESFDDLPYPTAISILSGDTKLVGMNSEIKDEPDNDQEYKDLLRFQFGGIYRNGIHQKAYRPYAYVNGYGPDDSFYACQQTGAGAPTIFSPHKNKWYASRVRFYCNDRIRDFIHCGLDIPEAGCVAVLFEEVPNVPIWVQTHLDPQTAVNEYLQSNILEERGAHLLRNEDAPAMARYKDRAKKNEPPPADEIAAEAFDPTKLPTEILAGAAEIVTPEAMASLLTYHEGDPPILEGDISQRNGWVIPGGEFYTCLYNQHAALARVLWLHLGNPEVPEYEQAAEMAGWAKIRSGGFIGQTPTVELVDHQPTDEQRLLISRWCRRHGEKFRDVLKIHSRKVDHEEGGESGPDSSVALPNDSKHEEGD